MCLIGVLLGWIVMELDIVYSWRIVDLSYCYNYAEYYNNFSHGELWAINGPIYEGIVCNWND